MYCCLRSYISSCFFLLDVACFIVILSAVILESYIIRTNIQPKIYFQGYIFRSSTTFSLSYFYYFLSCLRISEAIGLEAICFGVILLAVYFDSHTFIMNSRYIYMKINGLELQIYKLYCSFCYGCCYYCCWCCWLFRATSFLLL